MNNKGTTIVEIIVSIALISIILIFIFNLLSSLKNEDYLSNARIQDSLKRTEIIHIIQNDFIYKGLSKAEVDKCGNNICATFTFNDDTEKNLEVKENELIYDDEIWIMNGKLLLNEVTYCYLLNDNGYNLFKLIIPEEHDASSYRKLTIDLIYFSNKELELPYSSIGGVCI